ncbi:MAG: RNA polymerase sigma factor [Bacteroidaceae bacterium]|nr:RNA polymerase sigma factor [Bacteroidaceae bacterium]
MTLRSDILPHRDRLYRLALGITLHTAEAEDVVQETMIRAWEHREEWPTIQNIESWLTQICRNLALDRKKKMRTSLLPTMPEAGETVPENLVTHPSPEMGENLFYIVGQLITELPPPQDDIFRLRDIEGLSYRDIATQLNLSEDQVRVYLHRARQRLREKYNQLQNFGLKQSR